MTWRTSQRVLLVLLVLVVALGVSPTQTATATCSGSGCNGKDPITEGCSGTTVASATASGPSGSVTSELRWSSTCVANWARTTSNSGNRYLRAEVTIYQHYFKLLFGTSTYSVMTDGNAWHCAAGLLDTASDTYYDTQVHAGCG